MLSIYSRLESRPPPSIPLLGYAARNRHRPSPSCDCRSRLAASTDICADLLHGLNKVRPHTVHTVPSRSAPPSSSVPYHSHHYVLCLMQARSKAKSDAPDSLPLVLRTRGRTAPFVAPPSGRQLGGSVMSNSPVKWARPFEFLIRWRKPDKTLHT